jgi:hypothetical protein
MIRPWRVKCEFEKVFLRLLLVRCWLQPVERTPRHWIVTIFRARISGPVRQWSGGEKRLSGKASNLKGAATGGVGKP